MIRRILGAIRNKKCSPHMMLRMRLSQMNLLNDRRTFFSVGCDYISIKQDILEHRMMMSTRRYDGSVIKEV